MEIIHVVLGKANPQRMNGVNKVVYQLATQQQLAGKKVSVWGITKDTTHNYPERNFNTKLFRAYWNKFRLDQSLIDEVRKISTPVLFHLHGGFNPVFYSVSKLLHQYGCHFVFTPHGAYNEVAMQKNPRIKQIYSYLFEKKLIQRASYIHCLGKSEVQGLYLMYPKAKAVLLPYGFENETYELANPDHTRFIIGFLGRLDIYTKGLDILLKAFKQVKEIIPGAELWIIGDSNERQILEKMVVNEGIGGVKILGSKYGQEKNNLLKQFHVFAHPSRNEGLPSSILEAASLGLPCVVTEATNMGDVIQKHACGEVIKHPNVNELFTAMIHVYHRINTEGWETISNAARQMIKTEYNWHHIIHQFDKLYQSAC